MGAKRWISLGFIDNLSPRLIASYGSDIFQVKILRVYFLNVELSTVRQNVHVDFSKRHLDGPVTIWNLFHIFLKN